jgi:hypothetical protein
MTTTMRSPSKLQIAKAMSPSKVQLTASSGSKSPVKKAMRNKFELPGFQTEGEASGESSTKQLRTDLLNKVLTLLERDDSVVEFVALLVNNISKMPLENETMRKAFLSQLNSLEGKFSDGGKSTSSGRTKGLNVQHCREFILACVNEIVDLDESDPMFDYAESCADSEDYQDTFAAKIYDAREVMIRQAAPLLKSVNYATFDDVETLSSSSLGSRDDEGTSRLQNLMNTYRNSVPMAEDGDLTTCSVDCDDGSVGHSFPKIHAYARDMAKKRLEFKEFKRQMPMEPSSPLKKKEECCGNSSPVKEYATKYRSFIALKSNRNHSPLNMNRKKKAIELWKKESDEAQHEMSVSKIAVQPPPERSNESFQAKPWRGFLQDIMLCVSILLLAMAISHELKL